MPVYHWELKDYKFEPHTYESMMPGQQEIFIMRYATGPQLEQIVKIDRNSATYGTVAARQEIVPNRLIAASPITTSSTLARVYWDTEDITTIRSVARNENTPEWVLSEIVKPTYGDKMARILAWRNPSLSPDDRTPENDPMGRD